MGLGLESKLSKSRIYANQVRNFLVEDIKRIAKENPKIEFEIVKETGHPVIKGEYVNGKEKVICVRNYEPSKIAEKISVLANSSGKKLQNYTRSVESKNPSVRGIWSPFHVGQEFRYKV
ncbi:mitochondrial 54S ribosomal protein MRPL51 [Sugiyamaella lignohabitans]|uniref:Large ribosomal subunit protein mL43 n=1 Tax=Sugiyamaella lignohabitans TaxID=796027 RepID=A0A161HJ06_9ASCO|nr:mitochondrial 54S ribosomal protein MRPL51 [Sugiyamaella lignohabitans]ANB12617.1 mitochondrial 54S ribosomal protein MRPL51 [Sugiyamaella lignohabitans]